MKTDVDRDEPEPVVIPQILLVPSCFLYSVYFTAPPLTTLVNLSIEHQKVPLVWKSAFVVPHLK